MRTPWRGRQQLDFLCHDKRPELRGKAFHEVLVGENSCPVLPPVGVVIKLPQMNELVDRAGVGLEVAHELVVKAALLERREAEFLVELRRFRHLADVECVRSHFVQRHQGFSFINLLMQRSKPRPFSITSSARASSVGGTSRPSALAALRLMISSNFVGTCNGRSAGFSPLRMRSM